MKPVSIEEFKSDVLKLLKLVQKGQEFIVVDKIQNKNIAVLKAFKTHKSKSIKLGLLKDHKLIIHDDFKTWE